MIEAALDTFFALFVTRPIRLPAVISFTARLPPAEQSGKKSCIVTGLSRVKGVHKQLRGSSRALRHPHAPGVYLAANLSVNRFLPLMNLVVVAPQTPTYGKVENPPFGPSGTTITAGGGATAVAVPPARVARMLVRRYKAAREGVGGVRGQSSFRARRSRWVCCGKGETGRTFSQGAWPRTQP